MATPEKLPIKFFAKREIDEGRVEPGGGGDLPKWVLSGDRLALQSEKLFQEFSDLGLKASSAIEKDSIVPFVFVAKMQRDATSKSRRREIANLFQVKSNNIIGLTKNEDLMILLESLGEIKEISKRITDYESNRIALSCLDCLTNFEPTIEINEKISDYKIKLIDYQDFERNVAIQRLFEKLISKRGIPYKKTKYSDDLTVYKLKFYNKPSLDSLLVEDDFNGLFSVEPMPKFSVGFDSCTENLDMRLIEPEAGRDYAVLGILDNGIADIPHLSPWIIGDRWSVYPEDKINPTHGTAVSGIAIYGDLLEQKEMVGGRGVKLFDAVVYPDTSKEEIDEDLLIQNIIEAVSQNHELVKIWNLSLSISKQVDESDFSDFSIALDSLQDKFNILICKSAGNCENFVSGHPKGRINHGADSVRSLVVGSIAHEKGKSDLAEINNPSPFSRIGPGPSFIIKPEIVHYGGNAGVDEFGARVISGVKTLSLNGKLATVAGTSFSTPRISALVANISHELAEDFDPLLIKSLVIHSASYPCGVTVPREERTNQMGFGLPGTVQNILYNSPHEVTLILRDNLAKGELIDIMDFPMPDCLIKDGFYTGQIIVTLVYDPILEAAQRAEYCQSNIDVKFGSYDDQEERDVSKRNILNPIGRKGSQNILLESLYSKTKARSSTSDFALREKLLIQFGDKYYPVKKYAVDLSELTDGNKLKFLDSKKRWFLHLRGIYRDHIERKAENQGRTLAQEFCLMITVRDPSARKPVYNGVSQKLDEFNFVHNNIRVSSEIKVSV